MNAVIHYYTVDNQTLINGFDWTELQKN